MRSHDPAGRRVFLPALVAGLAPRPGRAQPAGKVARVGLLGSAAEVTFASSLEAFREQLAALGWIEGQTARRSRDRVTARPGTGRRHPRGGLY